MNHNQPQYDVLSKFSHQIRFTLKNYTSHGLHLNQFDNIIIGGLGGSGIGGQIIKSFVQDKLSLPLEVISDYTLPNYANKKTLLILGSYSGNTEETLSMYEQGNEKGCHLIIIASGGILKESAIKNSNILYQIESGFQPRMALGYSLTFLILIFGELLGLDYTPDLENIALNFDNYDEYLNSAKEIFKITANHLDKKTVIVTDAAFAAVGVRFAQQIQENAKAEAFVNIIPEANHNVIESYLGQLPSVFVFIHSHNNNRVSQRIEFLISLLEVENNKIIDISLEDFDLFSIYETIYRLDYYSLLMADHRGVNALNVPKIMELKDFLESVK